MGRALAFVGAPVTAADPALGGRRATRVVPHTQLRRVLPACLRPRPGVAQRPTTAAPSRTCRRAPWASVAAGNGTVGVPPPPTDGDAAAPAGTSPVRLLALVRQVWRLARPFWGGSERRVAWVWSAITVFLAFATTAYAVLLSFTQRMFWNALSSRDAVKFAKLLKFYAAAVIIGPIVIVTYEWAKARMALLWRRFLTERALNAYTRSLAYYNLEREGVVTNVDQRIAEDVRTFTDRAVNLLCIVVVSALDLVTFSVILCRIYPPLYAALLAYAAIGTSVTLILGSRLVRLREGQLTAEADARFSLLRLKDNVESVAFYGGEATERQELMRRFSSVFANAARLVSWERNVAYVTRGYKYVVQILPSMVVAPVFFKGNMEMGAISQTYFAFNHVLADLSIVVSELSSLAEFAAGARRLGVLTDALDREGHFSEDAVPSLAPAATKQEPIDVDATAAPGVIEQRVLNTTADPVIRLSNVSITTPGARPRPLVRSVSLPVRAGSRLLIMGDSGVGKSSLLRTIAGLWTAGSGTIERPAGSEVLFLPQRPYMTLGSLRENAAYPATPASEANPGGVTDEAILAALSAVNLGSLTERAGGLGARGERLAGVLSLGEQQRLAFARVVLSGRRVVCLDESTSALDVENETRMYELLVAAGVTVVSVGNRPTLFRHHDTVLRLEGGGGWSVEEASVAARRALANLTGDA